MSRGFEISLKGLKSFYTEFAYQLLLSSALLLIELNSSIQQMRTISLCGIRSSNTFFTFIKLICSRTHTEGKILLQCWVGFFVQRPPFFYLLWAGYIRFGLETEGIWIGVPSEPVKNIVNRYSVRSYTKCDTWKAKGDSPLFILNLSAVPLHLISRITNCVLSQMLSRNYFLLQGQKI